MDALERLREIAKETGEISPVYGGFEIKVLKPNLFPWPEAFDYLLEIGQEVWIAKEEGKICINSEPRIG